uniref:Uncharacterized protein n=1 Tax=Pithovirus LCDPAC01 TaxID=2506600 RepID=A0A481YP24_9VIRU|nr:MAG: hypothetical protein LCDPAC01_00330 [Pithovirus LCDPAC01]
MNNLEFDYEAPDRFVGTSGAFEFAVFFGLFWTTKWKI